jgi:HEAT repeat protein
MKYSTSQKKALAALFLTAMFITGAASAQDTDALLKEIADYQYNDSLAPLMELDRVLRETTSQNAAITGIEQQFIAFLESDATLDAKEFICEKLSGMGSEACVPVLRQMLKTRETSHMARIALRRIPGPAARQALIDELAGLGNGLKIGLIETLGLRGEAESVPALSELTGHNNPDTVAAAVNALGQIGGDDAVEALLPLQAHTRAFIRHQAQDALLECADFYRAEGDRNAALMIYETLDQPDAPVPVRVAALRGRVVLSGRGGARIVLAALASEDAALRRAGAGVIPAIDSQAVLADIARGLPDLPQEGQILLLGSLEKYGGSVMREPVAALAESENEAVRLAALRTLGAVGAADTAALLADRAASAEGREKEVARESLDRIPGEAADRMIEKRILHAADPAVQCVFIASAAARNNKDAADTLLRVVLDGDETVRREAVKALEALASPAELEALIDILLAWPVEKDRDKVAGMITAVARKADDPEKRSRPLIKALRRADRLDDLISLYQALGRLGDGIALPALEKGLADKRPAIRDAAVEALAGWPGPEPLPVLLKTAANESGSETGEAALRGAIRLIGIADNLDAGGKVEKYKEALAMTENSDTLQMALEGMAATGHESVLPELYAALDRDDELREAALRALADWPDAEPAGKLQQLAREGNAIALRGYVRMIGLNPAWDHGKAAALYAEAMELAPDPGQKKMLLSTLSSAGTRAAFATAKKALRNADLRADAEVALVKIAPSIAAASQDEVADTLTALKKNTESGYVRDEAEKILKYLDRFKDFITAWQVAGPYTKEGAGGSDLFDVPFPPEEEDRQAQWQAMSAGTHGGMPYLLELDKLFGGDQRVAYLRTRVWSDKEQPALLMLGSDDGVKAWLNGEVVHANNAIRPAGPDQDRVAVTLREGWNPLMLKIIQGSGQWAACARLRTPDNKEIEGLKTAAGG